MAKGNKKMMSGSEKQARRPGNVARTQARRDARIKVQQDQEKANQLRAIMREAKPWQKACALRRARRHGAGLVA